MAAFTIRLDESTIEALDRLAKQTDRSRSWLAAKAVEEYVALNAWQVARIEEGIAAADRGDFASDEDMRRIRTKKISADTLIFVDNAEQSIPAKSIHDLAFLFTHQEAIPASHSGTAAAPSLSQDLAAGWQFMMYHNIMTVFAGCLLLISILLAMSFIEAFGPITGGIICEPSDTTTSMPPATCGLKPTRFISGMVKVPVDTTLAIELPTMVPRPAEANRSDIAASRPAGRDAARASRTLPTASRVIPPAGSRC